MCLKRYITVRDAEGKIVIENGKAKIERLNTHVDIPIEITLPHFVEDDPDDRIPNEFKLVLQSIVLHEGRSVDSGHYKSVARSRRPIDRAPDPFGEVPAADCWLLFDDLAEERVRPIDIHEVLSDKHGLPYMLFYKIRPIDESPPSYAEAQELSRSLEIHMDEKDVKSLETSEESSIVSIKPKQAGEFGSFGSGTLQTGSSGEYGGQQGLEEISTAARRMSTEEGEIRPASRREAGTSIIGDFMSKFSISRSHSSDRINTVDSKSLTSDSKEFAKRHSSNYERVPTMPREIPSIITNADTSAATDSPPGGISIPTSVPLTPDGKSKGKDRKSFGETLSRGLAKFVDKSQKEKSQDEKGPKPEKLTVEEAEASASRRVSKEHRRPKSPYTSKRSSKEFPNHESRNLKDTSKAGDHGGDGKGKDRGDGDKSGRSKGGCNPM